MPEQMALRVITLFWLASRSVLAQQPFVIIAEPVSGSVVYGTRVADDRNRQAVRIVLHFYDLHLLHDENRSKLSVWFRVDRGQAMTVGPPLPASTLEFSMRLGTHIVEAALVWQSHNAQHGDLTVPAGVDPASVAKTIFDLMPSPGDSILRLDKKSRSRREVFGIRPLSDVDDYERCLAPLHRPLHVVLVGSLSLGGQAMLALEQARRLPKLRLIDGRQAFRLTYATSAHEGSFRPEPLRQMLEDLGVAVVRYAASIPHELITNTSDFERIDSFADRIGEHLGRYESLDLLPPLLEAVAGDLINIFKSADVVSFTNHETYISADQFIVECARLAQVSHLLNEPSNLWWGELPAGSQYASKLAGLILPSEFAAQFWAKRGVSVPLYVINPGVELSGCNSKKCASQAEGIPPFSDHVIRVGYVGRLAPQKSPGIFIRAAAILAAMYNRHAPSLGGISKRLHFVVIGDGPLREPVEDLARDLGLTIGHEGKNDDKTPDIDFIGWLAPEHVRSAIRNYTDVVVHTNVLEETFCMCNVEAMAEQRPVVSYGVGGVSEYLEHGDRHGVIVEKPSIPALVAALIDVVENPVHFASAGVAAARRVRGEEGGMDLSFSRMARQYANMYASFACETLQRDVYSDRARSSRLPPPPHPIGDVANVTVADVLHVMQGAVAISCEATWSEASGRTFGDPGLLLEAGKYWEGSCSMARHIEFVITGRGNQSTLESRDVDSLHALSLSLAIASEVFVTSDVPNEGTRAADALRTLIRVAEIGMFAAKRLDVNHRVPAFARIAATARSAYGGTPDAAAALFQEVFFDRRGINSQLDRQEARDSTPSAAAFLSDLDSQLSESRSSAGVVIGVNDGSHRSIELRLSDSAPADAGLANRRTFTSSSKLRHDARQLEYLAAIDAQPSAIVNSLVIDTFRRAKLENTNELAFPGGTENVPPLKLLARAYEHVADLCDSNVGVDADQVSLVSLHQLIDGSNSTHAWDPALAPTGVIR